MIDPVSRYMYRDSGQHGPVVFMYHSIARGRECPSWPWAVSLHSFRRQLDFLASEGWATPTVADLVRSPDKWKGRTAVITFDDGYVDNLRAAEELQKRGMRATWYIVTGSIGRPPTWQPEGQPGDRLLSADELRGLQSAGMELGAHTHNHKRLPELNDNEILTELIVSRDTLRNVLGFAPESFAYPYGSWNECCEKIVKTAGFLNACTTRSGWALRDNNQYQIRRVTVFNTDTTGSFARKLAFAMNDTSWPTVAEYAYRRLIERFSN